MKKSIVLATAVAAVLASGVATAELTGNATIASNYIWRGVSQTFDAAAGQGGIDWGHDSGFYAGTWVSNVEFGTADRDGYEMDVYAGFAGEAGSLGYDLGVITYQYPIVTKANFTEVYVSGTASIVTLGVNYTVDSSSGTDGSFFDDGDVYVSGSLDFAAGKSDVSIYAGSYMFENDKADSVGGNELDYIHYGASIGKDGFKFAVDKNDVEIDAGSSAPDSTLNDVRVTASYTIDFAL